MAFASAADALGRLLEGKEPSAIGARCWISGMPSRLGVAANGLEYCSVQVTCSNGAEYDVPAFGAEAKELLEEAMKSTMEMPFLMTL